MRPALSASLALATGLALATTFGGAPAHAQLVIEGRAAQALQCSAMLYLVAEELYHGKYITTEDRSLAQSAAVEMLNHVPGTSKQKAQAMKQRVNRIRDSHEFSALMGEYAKTAPWCQKTFL